MLNRINSCVFPESPLKLSKRDEPIHSFSKCSQAFLSTIANFSILSPCKLKVQAPCEPNAPDEYSVSCIHPQIVSQKDEANHSFMKCLSALLRFIAHSTLFKMFTSKPENGEPLSDQPAKEPVCHHPVSELSPPTFNASSLPIINEESPRMINEESPPTINEPFLPTNLRSSLHLLERIILLEKEMKVVKVDSMRSAHFQKKLDLLFELDEGDPNHSIKNFYYMAVNRLTAFATAIQSLSSGLVARNLSWKDNSVIYIISFLENSANIVGLAGTFAFGAGALVPIIALPILSGAGFLWEAYRDERKKVEYDRAVGQFTGGFQAIDQQNQCIAYGLAFLLQMQLRYCKPEGAQMILEDWLYRLCHNLLKADNISDAKVEKFVSCLVQIHKGKETKHVIKTYAKRRDWNTLGLFHKTGLAYYYKGELIYESCHVITKIDDKTVKLPMSKADKYGYLFFANHAEAIGYKKAVASENSVKKGVKSIHWHRDIIPRGPRMFRKDLLHLSSAITSDKSAPHSNPELRSTSHSEEEIDSHFQQAIRLKDSNRRLQCELQVLIEKLHAQEERVRVIEEKLASQQ